MSKSSFCAQEMDPEMQRKYRNAENVNHFAEFVHCILRYQEIGKVLFTKFWKKRAGMCIIAKKKKKKNALIYKCIKAPH